MEGFFGFNPVAVAIWIFGAVLGGLLSGGSAHFILIGFVIALGITILLSFLR